jgi:CheY-like chemotaxis protein
VSGPIISDRDAKKTVVFVGPTGVGKTTTIAKIAAHCKLKEQRSVALITLDTYRVAAVEQLKLYANIIGVSLEVALTKREALAFIRRRRQTDLILLDTTGRSPMDPAGVDELHELLGLGHPIETHLVMSATTRERDLMDAMSRYATLPIDHLLFTKLDETTAYGNIFTMMQRTGLSLSYFSVGQSVPEDLEAVRPERLADLILGAPLRSGAPARRDLTAAPQAPSAPQRAADAVRAGVRELPPSRPSAPARVPQLHPLPKAEGRGEGVTSVRRTAVVARKPAPRPRSFASRVGAWLGFGQGGNR